MRKALFAIVLALFLIPCVVLADSTVQHITIPLATGVASLPAGVNLTGNFNISAPDRIGKVVYAVVHVKAFFPASSNVSAWVNNKSCINKDFKIPSSALLSQYDITFDCSNILTTEGLYNFTAMYSSSPSYLTAWIDIGYLSNPTKVEVHGTEYTQGNPAKIYLQLLDGSSQPLNNLTCFASAFNPDNSVFFTNVTMTALGSEGLYYYDTPTLTNLGVYMVSVYCYRPALLNNQSTTLAFNDNFSSLNVHGGYGFGGNWYFVGSMVYDAIPSEIGKGHVEGNFLSIGGAFGTSFQNVTSFLFRVSPNATANFMTFDLRSITGNPQAQNYLYNISICPTSVVNLSLNNSYGADCSSPPQVVYANANFSALFPSIVQEGVPFTEYNFTAGTKYILIFKYVSGTPSVSAFWTTYTSAIVAGSNFSRRVNNATASNFGVVPDLQFWNTPANFINSSECFSNNDCLTLNHTTGYAQRKIDLSGASSVNITFMSKITELMLPNSEVNVKFYDGTWKIIKQWKSGQEHNWTFNSIVLNSYDYNFNSENIIAFEKILPDGILPSITRTYFDDINIYKTASIFTLVNSTEYQIIRGSTEIHVSPLVNISLVTNISASDVWTFENRTLTDYNNSGILAYLSDINFTVTQIQSVVSQIRTFAELTYNWTQTFNFSVNIFPTFNVTPTFNQTFNIVINETENITNVTNVFAPTFNFTTVENITQVVVQNVTTNFSVIVNTTNVTANFTPTFNFTTVENITNVTFNLTPTFNFTTIENLTNVTFAPVFNFTTVENMTNVTFNLTPFFNFTTVENITQVIVQNVTANFSVVVNTTNTTIDYETAAAYVWNSTSNNRTLTDYNLSGILGFLEQLNFSIGVINFSPIINIFPTYNISLSPMFNITTTLNASPVFNISANITVNASANINTTAFIEELLLTDVVEFPLTNGATSFGTSFEKREGFTLAPYSLFYLRQNGGGTP